MEQFKGYKANDGTTFETAELCKQHENNLSFAMLVDMTSDDVTEALDRANTALADAIELAGNIIARKRVASGEFKRKPPKKGRAAFENANK